MVKYYVSNIKGEKLYEGFDDEIAYRLCREYNNNCSETYAVDEIETDLDEFEEEDENTYVFYDNDYLTSLYGDDEGIKKDMKMAIEYITGKEIIDFDLDYDDPGDSGNDATFWAENIQWK